MFLKFADFYRENQIKVTKSSKTSVILDKTKAVDLCVPSISRPVAPRDHFFIAGLCSKHVSRKGKTHIFFEKPQVQLARD